MMIEYLESTVIISLAAATEKKLLHILEQIFFFSYLIYLLQCFTPNNRDKCIYV